MTALSETEVRHIAANSPSLDRLASIVCDEVVKMDASGEAPPFGVRFERIEKTMSFYATVHCVKLLVRYEQEIKQASDTRVLRGTFRARLDEPAKVDQTLISSFSFDSNGGTESAGDFIRPLLRGEFGHLFIGRDLALLLAHDVQQFIQHGPRRLDRERATD